MSLSVRRRIPFKSAMAQPTSGASNNDNKQSSVLGVVSSSVLGQLVLGARVQTTVWEWVAPTMCPSPSVQKLVNGVTERTSNSTLPQSYRSPIFPYVISSIQRLTLLDTSSWSCSMPDGTFVGSLK